MRIDLDYSYRPRSRASAAGSAAPAAQQALLRLIAARDGNYVALLDQARHYTPNFERIAARGNLEGPDPIWVNGWLPPLDAISIYALLAQANPRVYLEIGSGHSTKFARRAIADHGLRTEIVSIDPAPRAVIDGLCQLSIRTPLEDLDVAIFNELSDGDVVFVDSSHRAFQSSDVTVFMTEVLPMLAPGVVYGLHDIFLPFDYPGEWKDRFYNEQYLLQAYLLGGAGGDEIVMANYYAYDVAQSPRVRDAIAQLFAGPAMAAINGGGACFWMRRGRPAGA